MRLLSILLLSCFGLMLPAVDLVNDMGGPFGFGQTKLPPGADPVIPLIPPVYYSRQVDLTPIFPNGMSFYGQRYNSVYVNNNGNLTFGSPDATFTPVALASAAGLPMIAPLWAHVDTRTGSQRPTAGGKSQGSNAVWYNVDVAKKTFTATWDDVGYFTRNVDKLNAFQVRIIAIGDQGEMDIEFRYEAVNWSTGDASGGVGGTGGIAARAGITAADGNPNHVIELANSGSARVLNLDIDSNQTPVVPGLYIFKLRNPNVTISADGGVASNGKVVVPAGATQIVLRFAFDQPVQGFTASDVVLSGMTATKGSMTGTGANYSMPITISGNGGLRVDVPRDVAQGTTGLLGLNNAAGVDLVVDGTSPTAQPPVGPIYCNGPTLVTGSGSDDTGIAKVLWEVVSAPLGGTLSFQPNSTSTTTVIPTLDGEYTLRLTVTDLVGNTGFATTTLIRDSSPPVVNAGGPSTVAWAPSTAYSSGVYATNGGRVYKCITSGTSAAAGGPAGTSTAPIADGTAAWVYFADVWTKSTPVTVDRMVLNDGNYYRCTTAGTTASTGNGPTGIGSAPIIDGSAVWIFVKLSIDLSSSGTTATVTLNGVASTDIAPIRSYTWTQVSGLSAAFSSTNTPSTTVSLPTEGSYIFRLTVIDAAGNQATDDTTVNFDGLSTVSAGPDVVTNQVSVSLAGSYQEAFGTPAVAWSVISKNPIDALAPTFTPSNAVTTLMSVASLPSNVVWQYTVQMRVTDSGGHTTTDTAVVTFDSTAPAPASGITGISEGQLINRRTLSLAGIAEAGATVQVRNGAGGKVGEIVANDAGQWAITTTAFIDGAQRVNILVVDPAGNASPLVTINFVVDATPPKVTMTTTAAILPVASFTVTATFSEPIGVLSVPQAAAALKVTNGTSTLTPTNIVTSATSWTFTVTPVTEGSVACVLLEKTVTDAAGNQNDVSDPFTVLAMSATSTSAFTLSGAALSGSTGGATSMIVNGVNQNTSGSLNWNSGIISLVPPGPANGPQTTIIPIQVQGASPSSVTVTIESTPITGG